MEEKEAYNPKLVRSFALGRLFLFRLSFLSLAICSDWRREKPRTQS
jgi:hypothetical protein